MQFLRAIPPPALLPFGILVLGVGTSMKVFIIAFVCLWPVLLNTIDGVAGVEPTLRETAHVYGISARDRLLRITLPAASPQIFAGMRTALSLALILMVISEMVASTQRHRLLRAAVAAVVRDHRDVVGHPAARDSRVRSQRPVPARRAARAALAPRRPGERAELMLTVSGLKKSYGDVEAIADVSFEVARGEFVCVVGPSGCGKTTLLKCISGLLEPSAGSGGSSTVRATRWRSSSRSTAARCSRG